MPFSWGVPSPRAKEKHLRQMEVIGLFLGISEPMTGKSYQEVIAEVGPLPGLSDWCNRGALALRSGDISTPEFQKKLQALVERVEAMFDEAQPENMDAETYQVAQEYYESVSQTLDHYLEGMELMLEWSTSGNSSTLNKAKLAFQEGDDLAQQTTLIAFKLQDDFREMDEAIIQHLQRSSGGNAP